MRLVQWSENTIVRELGGESNLARNTHQVRCPWSDHARREKDWQVGIGGY